jgi:FkbM family methyltransferase
VCQRHFVGRRSFPKLKGLRTSQACGRVSQFQSGWISCFGLSHRIAAYRKDRARGVPLVIHSTMLSHLKIYVRNRLRRRLGVPSIDTAMERLSNQGFKPELIFDVGAYHGEYAQICRNIWPDATIACFEPQRSALAKLRAKVDSKMQVFDVLLGSEEKDAVPLHEAETASSVLDEHAFEHPTVPHPMRTVDSIVKVDLKGRCPELLKMDVQGYELEVLKGAEKVLPNVQVILAEVNLLDLHIGVPLMADLINWLLARDFVAFDICGLGRRPLDGLLWQADLIFVRPDSPLRRDKRWSTDVPAMS